MIQGMVSNDQSQLKSSILFLYLKSIGTVNSKLNGTPKGTILVVAKLLTHNNITINYYMQVNSFTAKIECIFEMGKKTPLGVPFILLLTVQ